MSGERGVSRRTLLGLAAGGAAAGVAGGIGLGRATADDGVAADPARPAAGGLVPFFGEHQAGIGTAAQDRMHFVALDLMPGATRKDLTDLLQTWTEAARTMVGGGTIGGPDGSEIQAAPPLDTGEARGLDPSRLTVTVGFGESLFSDDRFGIEDRKPAALRPLPHFAGDNLDPARSGGDIAIQACADDPQVAVHAIRNFVRLGHGVTTVRFSQLGFGRTSSTTSAQATPRNMLGFKDGTANLRSDDDAKMNKNVWVQPGDESGARAWNTGGSYLVARRIRMHIETWDRDPLDDQEAVIGRQKLSGAPFGKNDEFAQLDFKDKGSDGETLVDPLAHVRLAHPTENGGIELLRRGYSFTDGSDHLGRLDAGLFFISYQRSPRMFVIVQQNLAGSHRDLLNEYIQHAGSGLYAVPPGVRGPRDWWGKSLFS